MMHVSVGLHAHVLIDTHRAAGAHPPQIVALQVDQHHVFGAFLLVVQQRSDQRGIDAPAVAPRGRVPAIGRVETVLPRIDTSRSGEELSNAKSPSRSSAANGLGLVARRRR